MKKLAIFDFDGTLFNSVDDVVICFNEALAINDFPTLTHDEYIERLGGNIDEIISLILNDQSTSENIELIKKTYAELYSRSKKDNSHPFPGIHELLKDLQDKGVILTINSNRGNESLAFFVQRHFSDIDFSAIEGHDPDFPSKPNPYGVNGIMNGMGFSNDETLYIGDSATDIKTAQNAQIDCLIVRWGYGNQDDYENDYPLEVIETPSQIIKYF